MGPPTQWEMFRKLGKRALPGNGLLCLAAVGSGQMRDAFSISMILTPSI